MKTFGGRTARLTAAVTHQGKEIGAEEAKYRSIMSQARKCTAMEAKLRRLRADVKEVSRNLRGELKLLRALIQADRDILGTK